MSQTERLYKLKSLLDAGQCLGKARLLEELEASPATLKRDLAHLRDSMNAPIVFDRDRGGWRLDRGATVVGTQYELPGLWLSAEKIHALLNMQHLLAHLDAGGLLAPHIEPMMKRLRQMLVAPGKGAPTHQELTRRIHVQTVGARKLHLPHFQSVGTALLRRQRLQIEYHGRGRNQAQQREVSPQRLIHYRDNWYLDAWCHLRQALRSFSGSVDAIRSVQVLDQKAIDVPETELDTELGTGYGIFAGREVQWAHLRFSPERARWVAAETWQPNQKGRFDGDGCWLLELPYADPRELVMDILRHVPEVGVLGPAGLREAVGEKLRVGIEMTVGRLTP
ncbi:MAG: DNA-binding protein [Methylibium sp. NZG]|nr:MAG: DNA-binding protein [Methylibium sp. NZG]